MADPQLDQTHIYVARAWYRDTATWFNLASFLVLVLQEANVITIVPERFHPAMIAVVTLLNLLIRFQISTRPVALTEGTPVVVASIPSKGIDKGSVSDSTRSRFLPLILLVLLSQGCASMGGVRHTAVISVVSAHAVLSAVQDTEKSLVCGVAGAPEPPACIPQATHLAISRDLVTAFDYDGQVARLVRAVPPGGIMPADIPGLLGKIAGLVDRIVAALPTSAKKAQLVQQIAGVQ